jgi:hypothetical protein
MEQMAEVRPRLRLGRVGPKEKREALSRLGRLAVEEEIGEQRLGPCGLERQRGVTAAKVQAAEEPDVESRRPHEESLLPSLIERHLRAWTDHVRSAPAPTAGVRRWSRQRR